MVKRIIKRLVRRIPHLILATILAFFFWAFVVPVTCGYIGYGANYSGGLVEQRILDRAITQLKLHRIDCQDEELRSVLDYTIKRYHKISPFDVCISRCDWYPMADDRVLGMNNPLVPGITLDLAVLMDYDSYFVATVVLHEAMHDYYPYAGHDHVNKIMAKMEAQHVLYRANRAGARSNRRAADSKRAGHTGSL